MYATNLDVFFDSTIQQTVINDEKLQHWNGFYQSFNNQIQTYLMKSDKSNPTT